MLFKCALISATLIAIQPLPVQAHDIYSHFVDEKGSGSITLVSRSRCRDLQTARARFASMQVTNPTADVGHLILPASCSPGI
jgi:hypothetical protein